MEALELTSVARRKLDVEDFGWLAGWLVGQELLCTVDLKACVTSTVLILLTVRLWLRWRRCWG